MGLVNEARTYGGDLRKVIETIIDKSGLIGALQAENTDEARGRIENIQEFLGVVDEFTETHEDEDAMYEAPTAGGAELADEEAAPAFSAPADAPAGSFYAFAGANELAKASEGLAPCASCAATRWPTSSSGCGCAPTWTR